MTETPSVGDDDHPVSERWTEWRTRIDLDEYEERFRNNTAHGEADLIESLGARSVLDAGCGTGRVAAELARRGLDVVGVDLDPDLLERARRAARTVRWEVQDLAQLALGRRFDVVAMPGNVMIFCRPADRADVVRSCASHVQPAGALVAGFTIERGADALSLDEYDAHCAAAGLMLDVRWSTWDRQPYEGGNYAVSVHRPA